MKKIIIIHPHFAYPRGASRFVLEVAEKLTKKGMDILIVTIMADPQIIKPYTHLKFHFLGGPKTDSLIYWLTFPLFQWRLHRLLNTIPNKVLFPQVMPANWWAFIYKKFHPEIPLVWMCQEPSAFVHLLPIIESLKQPFRVIIKLTRPFLILFDKWLVREADVIIANSEYGRSLIKKIYNQKVDGIDYPGVDLNKFKPGNKKKNYIFAISWLDKQKRIDWLIRAYSFLPEKLKKEYYLIIGGEGGERKNLEILVEQLGEKEKIIFLGAVEEKNLPELYRQAKIVVFPAVGEPFGIIPIEAMACGTPVIANKGGGTEETIVNGETGFLISYDSVKILTDKMAYLLTHPLVLEQMNKKARKHIEKNFSWDKTIDIIESFLIKI